MQIKKKTLYILCSLVIIVIAVGCYFYHSYNESQSKERDKQELQALFQREWDKEYESQLRDYRSIIRTIKDWDYSYELRFKYVLKLNDLLGTQQYQNTYHESSTVDNCIDNLKRNEEADKELLKQKAYMITYKRFVGSDNSY